jgi:signal transduction histidine kinase
MVSTWPDSDITEISVLSEKFTLMSRRLSSLFMELRDTQNGLEQAVQERTVALTARTREVRSLLAKVESEREEERKRVAREIHDELGQSLSGLGMEIGLLERYLGGDISPKVSKKLRDIKKILPDLSDSVHRVLADLRPSMLDRIELTDAIARFAAEKSAQAGIPVTFIATCERRLGISEAEKDSIYRLCQEAVTNSIRHSGCSKVRISLAEDSGNLAIEVADDGKGLDPDSPYLADQASSGVKETNSYGILGMRERCLAQGGAFLIRAVAGGGTLVRGTFPIVERSNDASISGR